jgi:hypothetical protein
MAKVLTADDVIGEEVEQAKVVRWRKQWLVAGGFSMHNADILASNSRIDKDYANRLLLNAKEKGYDEEFVMSLLT